MRPGAADANCHADMSTLASKRSQPLQKRVILSPVGKSSISRKALNRAFEALEEMQRKRKKTTRHALATA